MNLSICKSLSSSRDVKIRRVTVEYKIHHESTTRCNTRGIRDLIMIHPVDELNVLHELGEIATIVDVKKDYKAAFPIAGKK